MLSHSMAVHGRLAIPHHGQGVVLCLSIPILISPAQLILRLSLAFSKNSQKTMHHIDKFQSIFFKFVNKAGCFKSILC